MAGQQSPCLSELIGLIVDECKLDIPDSGMQGPEELSFVITVTTDVFFSFCLSFVFDG